MSTVENERGAAALRRLALADDFSALLMFETLLERLTHLGLAPVEVMNGVPSSDLGVTAQELEAWIDDPRVSQHSAAPAVSVMAARGILVAALESSALHPVAREAIGSPDDTKLKAGLSLKIGAITAALMLVASTGFDVQYGGVSVHKEPLTVETLNALANLVRSVRGDLPALK
jgi:hypothetical protein